MQETIVVINAGSSSIKFSLFDRSHLRLMYHGDIDTISAHAQLTVFDEQHATILTEPMKCAGYEAGFAKLFHWLSHLPVPHEIKAVGHRVVHGGLNYLSPVILNDTVIKNLESLCLLAPLHQPHNMAAIKAVKKLYPDLLQVACFDTTFHAAQDQLARLLAIPRALTEEGILRYGFHGISYEYIASVLPKYLKEKADGKVIVAHLGHGASLCGLHNQKSVATSMGFTALDGLMMGTRCGSIDPGVILYLIQGKKLSAEQVSSLLYQESGLLGVSGISSDMRELQSSKEPNAIEAVELFCYRAVQEIGALCATLQGCDAIVFTAGIGEHSSIIRKNICDQLHWLGVLLDEEANKDHAAIISQPESTILVSVIPTNEEKMIAQHTRDLLKRDSASDRFN